MKFRPTKQQFESVIDNNSDEFEIIETIYVKSFSSTIRSDIIIKRHVDNTYWKGILDEDTLNNNRYMSYEFIQVQEVEKLIKVWEPI